MKILKWFGVVVISILLLLSLTVLGIAITFKTTILNPSFLPYEINKLPLSAITKQVTNNIHNMPPGVYNAINQTVTEVEPQLKKDLGSGISQIYDYLLGKKDKPELATTLRNSIASNKLINTLIDKLPLASLGTEMISEQLDKQNIPDEYKPLLDFIEPSLKAAEPDLKEQLKNAAPPVLDYLLGKIKSVKVTISLQSVYDNLIAASRDYYAKNLPPEASALTQSERDQIINGLVEEFKNQLPTDLFVKYVIDETVIGPTAPEEIASGIKSAESALANIVPYVKLFHKYFIILIIVTVLLVAAIVLIFRSVKKSTRTLGSIFLLYGVPELGGLLFGKYVLQTEVFPSLASPGASGGYVYPEIARFLQEITFDVMSPLEKFIIGIIILGIALLIISFLYRRKTGTNEKDV